MTSKGKITVSTVQPVKKPSSQEYPLVQVLRAINQITKDIRSTNSYTLLALVSETSAYFAVPVCDLCLALLSAEPR